MGVKNNAIKAAYQMGVQAERNRILALDEMMAAASMAGAGNVVDMLVAGKQTGASVDVMSRNMFQAMSRGQGNSYLRTSRHPGVPKSPKESAYDQRIAEYNKQGG